MGNIKFTKCEKLKNKPSKVDSFGKLFTDYMYVCEYADGKWSDGEIKPFDAVELLPCTSVLHYGQAAFEGLKAYRNDLGEVRLFRSRDNFRRLNTSCDRLCIPRIDEEKAHAALVELVKTEREWIPTDMGTSLYIRPFVFAADESLGVHAAKSYKFMIILSPSGAYYSHGFAPVALKVEHEYVRASKGGTGAFKVVGNYAASIKAGELAAEEGFDQVLWLDGTDRRYVEEVGSMNIFFAFGDRVITPALNGTILPGITRDSVIKLLKADNVPVEERRIDIQEIIDGAKSGALTEIFGTGTAAVISPVDRLSDNGEQYVVGQKGKAGKIASALFDKLTGIQTGKQNDAYGWVETIVGANK